MKSVLSLSAALLFLASLASGCNSTAEAALEKTKRELTEVSGERDRLKEELGKTTALVASLQKDVESLRAASKPAAGAAEEAPAEPAAKKKTAAKAGKAKTSAKKSGAKKRR